jgi:hypothetical protein
MTSQGHEMSRKSVTTKRWEENWQEKQRSRETSLNAHVVRFTCPYRHVFFAPKKGLYSLNIPALVFPSDGGISCFDHGIICVLSNDCGFLVYKMGHRTKNCHVLHVYHCFVHQPWENVCRSWSTLGFGALAMRPFIHSAWRCSSHLRSIVSDLNSCQRLKGRMGII